MSFNALIDRFSEGAPVATMVRALMANILAPSELDEVFRDTAERQYEDELLFSTVVDLLSLVVTKAQPSLHAAYQSRREQVAVSVKSLYDKAAGVEVGVCRAVVKRTAAKMAKVIDALEPQRPSLLTNYEVRILDGSHLAATEHRIKETRTRRGGPLPGQALVVLDPRQSLIVDMFPCQDGHAQERSLLLDVVEEFHTGQLWIADRNFCTKLLISMAMVADCCFLVREHAGLKVESRGPWVAKGRAEDGRVWEQTAVIQDGDEELTVRRVRLLLDKQTADGTRELLILTNLPQVITAAVTADTYHARWSIENAFGELTLSLRGEINTMGYPGAALLGYAIALMTYNLLSVVRSALRAVHGEAAESSQLSVYYLANEVAGTWDGMEIAIAPESWNDRYASLTPLQLAQQLQRIAKHASLRRYRKHVRGPKKPLPRRHGSKPHISTARLLAQRRT